MTMSTHKVSEYPIPTQCDFCGAPVILTSNAAIYGRPYGNGMCYKCTQCDSYVGTHTGTKIPLGRLANSEMRTLKKQCHALFDPSWQGNKRLSRERAYGRLSTLLRMPHRECHFGWFGTDTLRRCIEIMRDPDWYKGVPTS